MTDDQKANKAIVLISAFLILFGVLIWVPGFLGFSIPTTRPVNFAVFLTFAFSMFLVAKKSVGGTTLVLWGSVLMFGLAILSAAVVVLSWLISWRLPAKEGFYATIFLGAVGIIFWKRMNKAAL